MKNIKAHIKRLFLFAGFNQSGKIDESLIYYIENLHKFGDVILCMDSAVSARELSRIKKYTIYATANRHGEYDFGSYKRGFQYAYDNDILKKYDVLYLVNDSVYGPTIDLHNTIKSIEQLQTDAAGLIISKHRTHEFMESWFIRLNKTVFMTKWFYEFITHVTHQENKSDITVKYEHGLSNLIRNNGCTWDGVFKFHGRFTYNHPKKLFLAGCPFIKKSSFIRHNGAIGYQVNYVLNHCNTHASKIIKNAANNAYTEKYMNWFLTKNPITKITRGIKYATKKLRK